MTTMGGIGEIVHQMTDSIISSRRQSGFDPTVMFRFGVIGAWFDVQDMFSLFQDSAGTVPVTAVGQPVGLMRDKSGLNNHASQATTGNRPVLAVDAEGYYYLDTSGGKSLVVNFSASLGTSCHICDAYRGWGAVQRASQTIGTTYTIDYPIAALYISDRAMPSDMQTRLRRWANGKCNAAQELMYAVDSVNGNNANDGLSPFTAKQTISALPALASDQRIGLARGGYWREQIGTQGGTAANVTVAGYGVGKLPTLDAADLIVSGWSKTAGYTNIYQVTCAVPANSNGNYPSLWEDTIRLRWKSSIALADASPGSYYVGNATSALSVTYYVHASDSGDPATNGATYEYSARWYGLISGKAPWTVKDIKAKRPLHNDGALIVGGSTYRCIAEDGTSHNAFLIGYAEDCVAWKCDWPDREGATLFISYLDSAAGRTIKYKRCIAVCEESFAYANRNMTNGVVGFYAHTSGAVGSNFKELIYDDCSASGVKVGVSAGNADLLSINRLHTKAVEFSVVSGVNTKLADSFFKDGATLKNKRGADISYSAYISGLRISASGGFSDGIVFASPQTNLVLDRSSSYSTNTGLTRNIYVSSPSAILSINGVAFVNTSSIAYTIYTPWNNYSGDYNAFAAAAIQNVINNVNYPSWSAYRAGRPDLDAHSVLMDPAFADPANGDFTPTTPGFPTWAGCERPNIAYTPIPTQFELEAM